MRFGYLGCTRPSLAVTGSHRGRLAFFGVACFFNSPFAWTIISSAVLKGPWKRTFFGFIKLGVYVEALLRGVLVVSGLNEAVVAPRFLKSVRHDHDAVAAELLAIARFGPRPAAWGAGRAPSAVSRVRGAALSCRSRSAKTHWGRRRRSRQPPAGRARVSCGHAQ